MDERKSNSNGNILDAEKELQLKILTDKIEKLEAENTKLRILLKEYGCEEDVSSISDEEAVCVQQIARLKKISETRSLSLDETRQLDLFHKNLKMARGEVVRGRKSKDYSKMSTDELLNKV